MHLKPGRQPMTYYRAGPTMRHTRTLAPAVFCLTGALLAAQTPRPPAQSLFRAGTDLVVVDFLAVDANAQPVGDLALKELVLKVDGRPRDIRALQFVKVSRTSVETPIPVPEWPAPYGTNESSAPGRIVIIVVDHEQIRPIEGKAVFEAAARFLDRLSPIDRVGVITLPSGEVEADLTTNHERVRRVLTAIVGRASRPTAPWTVTVFEAVTIRDESSKRDQPVTQEVLFRECGLDPAGCGAIAAAVRFAREIDLKTRSSVAALRTFFEGMALVEGPKTVVFLSGALVSTATPFDFNDLARAAALGRAQLYVLQPHQPLVETSSRGSSTLVNDFELRRDGLRDLAANTGGVFFQLSGPGDNVFTRIADEISAYYVLGFTPQSSERDGKQHRIEVTSSRQQVTVRARPTFVITSPPDANAPPPGPRTMLRDFAAHRDLPLRATAYPFRQPDSKDLKIVVAVEPTESTTTLTSAAFALIDVQGRVGAEWTEDGASVVLRPLITAAAVPPGEYRLRVAAVDTLGRRGAADFEFLARLTDAGSFRIGSIMVGTLEQSVFKPSLLTDARAPDVTAYAELYGVPPQSAALTAVYELAARPDGPALAVAKTDIVPTKELDRRIVTGSLPLASVAAGDYVVRVIISLDGKEIGRAWRTLRLQNPWRAGL